MHTYNSQQIGTEINRHLQLSKGAICKIWPIHELGFLIDVQNAKRQLLGMVLIVFSNLVLALFIACFHP